MAHGWQARGMLWSLPSPIYCQERSTLHGAQYIILFYFLYVFFYAKGWDQSGQHHHPLSDPAQVVDQKTECATGTVPPVSTAEGPKVCGLLPT